LFCFPSKYYLQDVSNVVILVDSLEFSSWLT